MDVFGSGPNVHGFGCLEAGEPGPDVLDDLLGADRDAFDRCDEGGRPLAPALVGHADDRHLEHARWVAMTCSTSIVEMFSPPEMITSLARSLQLHVAVGVHHAEVAGEEPAVRRSGRRGAGVAVVAAHHVVAADRNLADRRRVGGHVVALVVHDPQRAGHDVGHSLPGLEACPCGGVEGVPVRIPVADRDRTERLGQPVEVRHLDVEVGHAGEQRR